MSLEDIKGYLLSDNDDDTTPEESARIRARIKAEKEAKKNKEQPQPGMSNSAATESRFALMRKLRHQFNPRKEIKKTEYIGGLFPRGYVSVVAGAPGVGKTIFEQRIAHDLSMGGDIFGGKGHEDSPRKSIIISGELKEEGFIERAQQFDWYSDMEYLEVIDTLTFEEDGISFFLNEKEGQANIEEVASTQGLDVLFIDSLGTLFGGKENDNSELIKVFRFMMRLASKHNIAVVVMHHGRKRLAAEQRKPLTLDDLIGGNAISRYAHTVYAIEYNEGLRANLVRCLKTWGVHTPNFAYSIRKIDNGGFGSYSCIDINLNPSEIDLSDTTGTTKKSAPPSQAEIQRAQIKAILKAKENRQATTQEIRDILGIKANDEKGVNALRTTLKRMTDSGEIIKPDNKRGFYALPDTDDSQPDNEEARLPF